MQPKTIIFSILLTTAVIVGIYFLVRNSKSGHDSTTNDDICSHCGELKCNPDTGECSRSDNCNNISKPDDTTDCKNVCVRNRWICDGTDKCEKNTLPVSIGSCSLEQLVCDTDLDQLYCASSSNCNGNPLYFEQNGIPRCVCQNGSHGKECQYTNAGTCNNNGTVSDDGNCTCKPPYYGKKCESQCSAYKIFVGTSCVCDPNLYTTVGDTCVPLPCANGTPNKTTGVCTCDDGYTNVNKQCISKCNLQTQVWDTVKNKCVKKSTCTNPAETVYDKDGNFTCVCNVNECGLNCEYTRGTCHDNGTPTCLNNELKGCKCDNGYTGIDCSCETSHAPTDYTECLGEFPVCNNGDWSIDYKKCNDKITNNYSIDNWNNDCFSSLKGKNIDWGKITGCRDNPSPPGPIVPIITGCSATLTKCPDTQVNLCDFSTEYNWECVDQIKSTNCLSLPFGTYCIDQNGKQDNPICYPCGTNGSAEWVCNNEGSLPSTLCIEANGIKKVAYNGYSNPIYVNSQDGGLPVYPTTDVNACELFLSGTTLKDPFSLGTLGIFNVSSKLGNPKKVSIKNNPNVVIKLDDNDGNRYFLPYSQNSTYDKDVRCPFPDNQVIKYIVDGTSDSNLCNGGKFTQVDSLLASGTCACLKNYIGSNCEVPTNIVIAIDNTESIPSNWFECNGSNNTPNLAGRFVMMGTDGSIGATGGNSSHSITVNEMYAHSHTYSTVDNDTIVRGPSNGDVSCVISNLNIRDDSDGQRPTVRQTSGQTGANVPFSCNPPYLAVSYITTNSSSSSIPLGAIIWFYNKDDTKAPDGWEIYTKATGKLLVGKNETFKNTGGSENVVLTSDNLPSHTHDYTIQYSTINQCAIGAEISCLDQNDIEFQNIVDTVDTATNASINIMPMYMNLMCIRKTGNTGFVVGSICALYNNTIPSDWTICDGNNNTPDLRGYFIRSSTEDIGSTGGNKKNLITIPVIGHTHKTVYYQNKNKGNLCSDRYAFVNTVSVSTAKSPLTANNNTTTEVGGGGAIDISPPYYTLLYIMKFKKNID